MFIGFVIGFIQVIPIMVKEITSGSYDAARMTEEIMNTVSAQTPVILLVSVLIAVPSYYLIYRTRKQELMTFVSVRGTGAVSIPVLIVFGLSVNFIIEWLLSLVSEIHFLSPFFEQYDQLAQMITGGSFVMSLLTVGIIGPVFEEILFRGLIFGELRKITKVRLALFIQGALFGIYHLNVIQGSYAFIIGILLGYVYYRSNSIVAPMIVHATINTSSVILGQLSTSALDKWAGAIIAAAVILFLATGAFIVLSRKFRHTMDDSLYYMNRTPAAGDDESQKRNG
jgi:membrane protease YdiL (CAAX protease family)